jgi:tetratricopeptide (TPR) repeat protein
MSKRTISSALLLAACLGGACRSSRDAGVAGEARLYDGFGGYHRAVTTSVPEAQRWFDQGLQFLYGFNHDEAIRSFEEAGRIDPQCAMTWWGAGYAHGLHINNMEMSDQASRAGFEATEQALARLDQASPVEAALIRALAERYEWPAPEDRKPLDQAYADAMERVWREHRTDPDVGALYAESLMNLQPWDYWTKDGEPKGRASEIVAVLEEVLRLDPEHPGANHFYIHAVEASRQPERAVAAADRLSGLVPGAGHLVHMPSHIYTRVGRYGDAADTNERAIAADRAYFALAPPPDFYSLYFVHNVHFLAYAAMMEGRKEKALEAARRLEKEVPADFLEHRTSIADGLMATPLHVMVRFGMWSEILAEPEPAAFRLLTRAQRHYARGVALSALGRTAPARAEMAAFERVAATVPAEWTVGNNDSQDVLALSRKMLEGELLFREGKHDESFAVLREAAALEDQLVYDEPPGWMQPVRHALGALLMSDERWAEAEAVYREDLAKNPENGWSLLGLEQALRAQGREAQAAELGARRAIAWKRADVRPTSSCYCERGHVALAAPGS